MIVIYITIIIVNIRLKNRALFATRQESVHDQPFSADPQFEKRLRKL